MKKWIKPKLTKLSVEETNHGGFSTRIDELWSEEDGIHGIQGSGWYQHE